MGAVMAKPGNMPRGPAPQSFGAWVRACARKGCRRFRVQTDSKEPKVVALKNANVTARLIETLEPLSVEALDDEGAILRVWEFADSSEPASPGYVKDDGDTEDERVLKTFAHLLADAHKEASKQLVQVVTIQSAHFAEERRSLMGLRTMNERLMAALSKKTARIRIAPPSADGEEPLVEEETDDSFLQELLRPMLMKMAKTMASEETATAAPQNGAAKE